KEYCACTIDDEGVLILSEFAGAAAQLGRGALLVNPYDTEGVADAIHRGCRMSDDQRRARMRRLRRSIRRNDVFRWADAFLRAALAVDGNHVNASSPARKLRLVAGTIGNLHRCAGLDRAIQGSARPGVCAIPSRRSRANEMVLRDALGPAQATEGDEKEQRQRGF
ncbi:MAG: trehalose-6-phosphate synthase, partial [Gammaproteobacteria bacterium]